MNAPFQAKALDDLVFDHSFLDELPGDPVKENTRRQVRGACWSEVAPRGFPGAATIACSSEMLHELGLAEAECGRPRFAEVFSGTRLLPGMRPYAQNYGGHQFGVWAGQLGDGRAINLGAVTGISGGRWELQLKGAGPTPYSRSADGLAVLRSSIREFLCSEAMHHLGVPTTRALSLVGTGEKVVRDMFYDGHPREEPGAVVCRVAPSFLRFGSYQIFASRNESEVLRQLADYTLRHHFPELGAPGPDSYARWFGEVCRRTADLMVEWMRVGFVHGVMNTDNMSILGLTIDYGPYGWLEDYDPDWTPNTTDAQGRRYRFGQQPQVALWNLVQLANTLYPLIEQTEPLEEALQEYRPRYERGYMAMMAAKLGLREARGEADEKLVLDLLQVLQRTETDMTLFFRGLAEVRPESIGDDGNGSSAPGDDELLTPIRAAFYDDEVDASVLSAFAAWMRRYCQRVREDGEASAERQRRMNAVNPKYVLRNWLAQQAIDRAEEEDYGMIHELLDVLRRPYEDQSGKDHLATRRPEWARNRPGCSMLSCSS